MPKVPFARLAAAVATLGMLAVAGFAAFAPASNVYVVQPGDSLWAIAQRSGVSMQQLAAANHMQLSDILVIGRHLTIPGASAASAATPAAPAAPAARQASGSTADFCATYVPTAAPRGVLPSQLRASASRLALRPLFVHWGATYGVQPALLEAIAWQESGWQQGVVSSAQAVGVGQLLPVTASFVSSQLIGMPLDITSTSDNIRMMARFVAYLQVQEGSVCRTIASYYEGPSNMARYGVLTESRQYVADVEYLIPAFS